MQVEVTVGPPVLTLNQGNTFVVSDLSGEIAADSEQGIFSNDTRFVSYYSISANGTPWQRLSSSAVSYYAARIFLTNQAIETEDGIIEAGTISLNIFREVGSGLLENFTVTNFSMKRARFNLEIAIRNDFADIFEVRAHKFVRRGRILSDWNSDTNTFTASYTNNDFERVFKYRLLDCSTRGHLANGRIVFELDIAAGEKAELNACMELLPLLRNENLPNHEVGQQTEMERLHHLWKETTTQLTTSNEDFYRLYSRSVEDMGALRLYDGQAEIWTPAAGVPWYVTLFGRDSLIASHQCMPVNPKFGLGALSSLAQLQATEVDDYRDAQPGKIAHEMRLGELAHFKKIPHTPYYGTADATALYLIILHETWRWLGDDSILKRFEQNALDCLSWIDKYGDLDGDGFQEYATKSARGYENMGWKDSIDAVVYADGSQVKQPKALCELQGYVYDAWMRMSEVFSVLGQKDKVKELQIKAKSLKAKFAEKFWLPDEQYIAFALDKDKKPASSISSNAGHCLWSGILMPEHASKVIERLFQEDMWSGWGIRTMSALNPAYNPHSYHLGSVWPHDNGIIAIGCKRYGFADEANRIARDISQAASCFSSHRLPELYAGIKREADTFPVQYLGANVPQAWAAGSVFHLLRAILGLHADAPRNTLYVSPTLPRWLPNLELKQIAVADTKIDLKFWREGDKTLWSAEHKDSNGNLKVIEKSWQAIESDFENSL